MANLAKPNLRLVASGAAGFSIIELMVALMFTGLLMAGMAQVFKTSLGTFYTSGEVLSATRRNRASIDLLYDDLNSAGMYLTSLSAPPMEVTTTNPPFKIEPNQPIALPGPDGPSSADELFFYLDQPLGFEGTIAVSGRGAAEAVFGGGIPANQGVILSGAGGDSEYKINCGDAAYATQLVTAVTAAATAVPPKGLAMVLKDSWETLYFTSASASGSTVTITAVGDPGVAMTGVGSQGSPSKARHVVDAGVVFYKPSQMVRYSIKMKVLDPQNSIGIPCLIRDQAFYSGGAFVADPAQETIITENVSNFKAYLSVDSGTTWLGKTGASASWDALRTELNTKLSAVGREGNKTTVGNEHWFRKIPTLVRLDITTRTATKRTEYSTTATTSAFREVVQSLVLVPRHFGLPIN